MAMHLPFLLNTQKTFTIIHHLVKKKKESVKKHCRKNPDIKTSYII